MAAHHRLHLIEQKMLAEDRSQKELWTRFNREFHQTMIRARNTQNIMSLNAVVFDTYLRCPLLLLTDRRADAIAERRTMFEAALARDMATAKAALDAHIRNGLHQKSCTSPPKVERSVWRCWRP